MTTETHHRIEELLPAYALGAAEPAEAREVEAHLEGCAECRAELAAWRGTAEAVASAATPVPPPPAVRARLLARVGEEAGARESAAPGRRLRRTPLAAALAAAALAVGALAGLGWSLGERSSLEGEVAGLESEVARLRRELSAQDVERARAEAELRSAHAVLALVAGSRPGGEVVLAGLEAAPEGRGRLVVDPERRRAVLLAGALPPLPEGRVYQLWTLTGGTPASAGVFQTVAGGTAIHVVDEVPERVPDAWAVTIEPEGGVPQPTGPMVLVS